MDLLLSFKRYLIQDKKRPSKITVKNYLADARKFISWFEETFHREFIPTLVTKDVVQIYQHFITRPNQYNQISAATSVKRYLSSLKKFYAFLIAKNIVKENPFELDVKQMTAPVDEFHLKEFKNFLLLSHINKVSRKNYMADIGQFVHWLKNLPQKTTLTAIDSGLIEEYKNRLLYEAKFSPVSVNRKLSSLRKYFSWAQTQSFMTNTIELSQVQEKLSEDIQRDQEFIAPLISPAPAAEINQPQKYSKIPPVRLFQKISQLGNSTFDLLFLLPIVKLFVAVKYQWWKLTGRKIFTTSLDSIITNTPTVVDGVKNLPKSFYAPLKLSTRGVPIHLKIYYHLRHSRPMWYKKYHSYALVHYFHFGVLLVYALILGFTIYHALIESPGFGAPALATLDSPPRMLSFSGRLTDDTNTPITTQSNLRFGLYNDKVASGSALIWQEVQQVQPDHDGKFQVTLGQDRPITQAFLNDNPSLFLGVTIENGHELAPREQIATIPYAKDTQSVQSMLPSTDPNAGTANILLALDSSGSLTIGGKASPKFEATGGEFSLSGQTLTLTTSEGSNSNVQVKPDGSGIIDLQKPIQNTTNYSILPGGDGMINLEDSIAIAADSATQSALLINQNSTGDLISADSNNSAKFTVDYQGSGTFTGDLSVGGNNLSTSNPIFNLVTRNVVNLNIGNSATSISIGAGTGVTIVNNNLNVFGLLKANNGLFIPSNKSLTFAGRSKGAVPFIDENAQVSFNSNNFSWDNANQRLGIGTAVPAYRLDVQDNQEATVAARIYNLNTTGTAEGLNIRLGNTAATVDQTNHFINFETDGIGLVGAIRGNGSNGIQITNAAFADWAEYLKKDPAETIPFGSLVCVNQSANATACDDTNSNIVGVASEHPTVIAGENRGDGSVAVGLTGLVKALVSSQNGAIKPGDLLTVSATPGVGVKAIGKGVVVGRALESYDNTNSSEVGSILISLQTGWFDPKTSISQTGDVLPQTQTASDSSLTQILTNIANGFFEAKSISTQVLSIATDNITVGTKTLKEYIDEQISVMAQKPLISPIAQFARLNTDLISPLASDSAIALQFDNSKIQVIDTSNASASAVATIDNQGNASFSGDLAAQNATLSGTLHAKKIIADEIEGLNIQTATTSANYITNVTNIYTNTSSSSATPLIPDLNVEYARFNQGVIALGASSLTDVSVTGQLHVGQSLVLSENAINTIGADLELQPLRQGMLSLMGGLVRIDTDGNLAALGNATFAKDVNVQGVLSANIISPVPASDLVFQLGNKSADNDSSLVVKNITQTEIMKINQLGDVIASGSGRFRKIAADAFTIVRGAQADTSFTQTIASSSAGTAVITANETERTIVSPYMKEDSLIYITPTSETFGQSLYIARQTKNSFTIQISHPVVKNVKLNWWIIN